ncbi:MAG: DALR anticodon-binding domain-containing protein, partial [Alphaproteobacteria bacterium]|nr:DALR anticodon-binding domain-containing protein [Alphaproteobacteria bacterium]
GVIRILDDSTAKLSTLRGTREALITLAARLNKVERRVAELVFQDLWNLGRVESQAKLEGFPTPRFELECLQEWFNARSDLSADLLAFFADRLKVHLRDEGIRHDVIDAVFALGDDDLVRVTAKARALQAFLDTEDGAALLAGFNRAANILKAEEKKSGETYAGDPDADYLAGAPEADEQTLIRALSQADPVVESALAKEDFTAAMAALAGMRAPIDAFFENVTVNTDDERLRRNRLLLLSRIRTAVCAVADFDKISG